MRYLLGLQLPLAPSLLHQSKVVPVARVWHRRGRNLHLVLRKCKWCGRASKKWAVTPILISTIAMGTMVQTAGTPNFIVMASLARGRQMLATPWEKTKIRTQSCPLRPPWSFHLGAVAGLWRWRKREAKVLSPSFEAAKVLSPSIEAELCLIISTSLQCSTWRSGMQTSSNGNVPSMASARSI